MANQVQNPFENEKPKIVHFEKNESHYEYCRMQMHDIERTHRRTFFCHVLICLAVCFLSLFKKYIAGFDLLSRSYLEIDHPGAVLAGGIFTIVIALILMVIGYLAWANFRTLNIILAAFYLIVTLLGIFRLDYLSALTGIVGAVFYFFSIREMGREQALSEMEGYPDFQETFDISKSDIVIQTLLAHQGEKRTKSTLFTTDYSLRRMKKKKSFVPDEKQESSAGEVLAEVLQQRLDDVKDARQARTAIAALDAAAADIERSKEAKKEMQAAEADAMTDILTDAPAKETEAAPEETPAKAPAEEAAPKADALKAAAQHKPQQPKQNGQPNPQNRKKKRKKK